MSPNIQIHADAEAVAQAAASFIAERIATVLQHKNRFTIALSGGSTPKRLHQLLAKPEFRDRIAWDKVHFFWGDERYVPLEDERNNARMAFDTLLNHIIVPDENVHVMST